MAKIKLIQRDFSENYAPIITGPDQTTYTFAGTSHKRYTKIERFGFATRALAETCCTLGLGLLLKSVRNDWKYFWTGKKTTVVYSHVSSNDPIVKNDLSSTIAPRISSKTFRSSTNAIRHFKFCSSIAKNTTLKFPERLIEALPAGDYFAIYFSTNRSPSRELLMDTTTLVGRELEEFLNKPGSSLPKYIIRLNGADQFFNFSSNSIIRDGKDYQTLDLLFYNSEIFDNSENLKSVQKFKKEP